MGLYPLLLVHTECHTHQRLIIEVRDIEDAFLPVKELTHVA